MARQVDLLKGNILRSLTLLALPIMGSQLVQMAYNLTDMIWIGRVGAGAAACGAACCCFHCSWSAATSSGVSMCFSTKPSNSLSR